jgi:hypothetical protein
MTSWTVWHTLVDQCLKRLRQKGHLRARVQDQPGQNRETSSQKTKQNKTKQKRKEENSNDRIANTFVHQMTQRLFNSPKWQSSRLFSLKLYFFKIFLIVFLTRKTRLNNMWT